MFQVNRSPQRSITQYALYLAGLVIFAVLAGYISIWLSFNYHLHFGGDEGISIETLKNFALYLQQAK